MGKVNVLVFVVIAFLKIQKMEFLETIPSVEHLTVPVPINTSDEGSAEVTSRSKVKSVTILGLFELTQGGVKRGHGASEKFAAEMALKDINRKRILKDYKLTMLSNDTKCDAGAGVDAFFHALYTQKNIRIVSLLGSACSEVTERLAKVVPYWNIIQVSYGSTSPALSHRKEFPLFYRTVSPVSSHNDAILSLIRHFGWDTLNFFTQNENKFTMPMNILVTNLEKANVTVKATLTFSMSDLREQLEYLKDVDARIIIASFNAQLAPTIFCQVHEMGMYGRDYAWILIGKPERRWWVGAERGRKKGGGGRNLTLTGQGQPPPQVTCTLDQLGQTMENALIVDRHNFIVKSMTSVSGMDAREFRSKFQGRNLPESPYGPEAYDAVWAIALALKNVQELETQKLEQFDYDNTNFSQEFMRQMKLLVFNGISGPISFSGGDRIGVTSISQVQEKKVALVGLFFPTHGNLSLGTCAGCSPLRWHGNQVPISRREFRFKLIQVTTRTYLGVAMVSTFGILMAISFLIFNLYNRKLKYIKLSSPRLNNILIIGSIFAYVAVILLGTEDENEQDFAYVCTIRAYLLSTGFSLAFGAMFAKTYRVHRIFTRSCIGIVKNKLLRDRQLMGLILALLVIDTVIVFSWATFDPMHKHRQNLSLEIDPSDRSVVYQQQIKVCRSTNGHVWLSIMYGYKSLLLAVGLYMAWETRHVKIQVLNDSKYIGLCVYIVVLTSVLGVSLANLLSDKVTLSFLTVTSLILTATTATLCLLFLPKVYAIVKKKHLSDPVVESSGLKIESNTRRFLVEDTKELLFRAEVQNRVYKRQIEAIDAEMWRLEKILLGPSSDSAIPIAEIEGQVRSSCIVENDDGSSDSSSEIYTVYLHRPRFLIPISLLHFQNGTNTIADFSSVAAFAASALTGPRSSWPSTSQRPSIKKNSDRSLAETSEVSGKYRFKSEPKLPCFTESETDDVVFKSQLHKVSAESLGTLETVVGPESRKSSSPGTGAVSSLFSALKSPLAYMTGLLKPPTISVTGPGHGPLSPSMSLDQHKYGSVPDLWGVRTSPGFEKRRATKVSVLGQDCDNVERLPGFEDPLIRFIPTTQPSPYI